MKCLTVFIIQQKSLNLTYSMFKCCTILHNLSTLPNLYFYNLRIINTNQIYSFDRKNINFVLKNNKIGCFKM